MWIVEKTPANYFPPGGEPWCIMDPDDGDIHNFYTCEEDAIAAFKQDFKTDTVLRWKDWVEYQNKINNVIYYEHREGLQDNDAATGSNGHD